VTRRFIVATFIAVLAGLLPSAVLAQSDRSLIMGTVIDDSGGALPGVTVTVSGAAIAPASVVTDGAGRYLTPSLPPGSYTVTFVLSGFETRALQGVTVRTGQTLVLDQQLPLAALSEVVQVIAPAPLPPPSPPPPAPPKIKRPPTSELLASVCGPRQAPDFSLARGRIVGHRDAAERQLFGPGDVLRIDAGADAGMAAGQNYVIRRRFQTGDRNVPKKLQTFGEHTAGLVQIIDVERGYSNAMIIYSCGEILAGDSVEPYVAQPATVTVEDGTPNFDDPARITIGEEDRTAGASGQMMVIDRGVMQGVKRGQRLTIFRRGQTFPLPIGEAIIVAVRPDSATIRIDQSSEAALVGDLVAIHR
jgi:hypothetical protein